MPAAIRAAAYYRKSSPKQEDSIDRQRSQVQPYGRARGYDVVAEYVDEGIAGDVLDQRAGFRQLLGDAALGKFDLILCDDRDRLSRSDSVTFAQHVAGPLRRLGVRLETVSQGVIDLASFAGRVMNTLQQEMRMLEVQNLAGRVQSELLRLAQQGKFLGGPVPYGYRLLAKDAPRPGPYPNAQLAPDEHADVVRLIFRLAADDGFSIADILDELERRGVRSPSGRPRWSKQTVWHVLSNRRYLGEMPWNQGSKSKYAEVAAGALVRYDHREKTWRRHEAGDVIVVAGVHGPIVDAATFARARAVLARRRQQPTGQTRPQRVKTDRPVRQPAERQPRRRHALAGLLVCSHCGRKMSGATVSGKPVYRCSSFGNYGACNSNSVQESAVLPLIVAHLRSTLLSRESIEEAEAELERLRREHAAGQGGRLAGLQKRQKKLAGLIAGTTESLPTVAKLSEAEAKHLIVQLAAWRAELAAVEKDVSDVQNPAKIDNLEEVVRRAKALMFQLDDVLAAGDPRKVNLLLGSLVDRVELEFTHQRRDKRIRSCFTGGTLHVRLTDGLDVPSCAPGRL